jgi:acetylglutamate kinase
MIPKLTNAFEAIQNGVNSVKICHALKVGEAANNPAIGTLIVG